MELKYRRQGYRYAHNLPVEWEAEDDLEEMAEAAAQDYWSNHDGFEARWPLTFEILLPDGGLIGSAEVEMDTEPVFTAKPHNADVTVGRLVDERNTEGPRGTYGCACVADSAHACAEIRYGYRDLPEPCECLCHQWRDDDDE